MRSLPLLVVVPLLFSGCAVPTKRYSPGFGGAFDIDSARARSRVEAREVAQILGLEPVGEGRAPRDPEEILTELRQLVHSDRVIDLLGDLAESERRTLAAILGLEAARASTREFPLLAALELRLRFAAKPVARLPVRVAFVEAGTDDWSRVMPAGDAGVETPSHWSGTVARWDNATSLAGRRPADFDRLRHAAARLQADILALVEYDWALEETWEDRWHEVWKLKSKVQVTVVDTQSGVVLGVFEEQVGEVPPRPILREPREYYREYRLKQLARLRARLEISLAGLLRRELPARTSPTSSCSASASRS